MIKYGNSYIIGVDIGNYNMKTSNECFPSAYIELAGYGSTFSHQLSYQNKFFALGGNRVPQRDDKADINDDYLILTLFAIARELSSNGFNSGSYDIFLGASLPPSFMNNKAIRANLRQYFSREFSFTYNDNHYDINIQKVLLCPQATAALYGNVLTEEMTLFIGDDESLRQNFRPIDILIDEPISILIDIGGGTVDIVVLHHGAPQPFEDDHPAKGVIFTYNRIIGQLKSKYGSDISENAINMLISGEKIRIRDQEANEIHSQVEEYAMQLYMRLEEKKLPFSTAYTLVQGGGVKMVKDVWLKLSKFAKLDFLAEIRSTAIGSEQMVLRMLQRSESNRESKVG